ncbi:MAG: dihydropteroate synthase [Sodaliphilus sp.]|nr:dihydropteroate synthase [Bacteroidales bacterium]MDY5539183.1 dihydropteroate synthase [Sodaliphilus sp.]
MLNFKPFTLSLRDRTLVLDRPQIMGIVNVTPDSFYSASRTFDVDSLEKKVEQMVSEGVDIFDIGAYSTRLGADDVSPEEELRRLQRGMEVVKRMAPNIPVSIDTFRANVARTCVEEMGADIVNDVSGGTLDADMAATMGQLDVPYILMHMRGTPATMQQFTDYPGGVVADVVGDLKVKMEHFREQGCRQVILDPGFGFSKTLEQNYELMNGLTAFHELNAPLLVGISRKSMIFRLLGTSSAESLEGTTVLNTIAMLAGSHILRVHDVRAAVEARTILEELDKTKA